MAKKIDRRRTYILQIDTETANTLRDETGKLDTSSGLTYDIGFAIIDKQGRIYEYKSFVVKEVFSDMPNVMDTAYYKKKLPIYYEGLRTGEFVEKSILYVRKVVLNMMEKYRCHIVCAHNAFFDCGVLNSSIRYLTKSRIRYFFPFGTIWWDTLKMAKVIQSQKGYRMWCEANGAMTNGQPSKSAENLYRYISGINDFDEHHTGLEDVKIESKILAHCFRQHKAMTKELWQKKDTPENTPFQIALMASLKREPTLRWAGA